MINRACAIDHAGEAVLEFLLLLSDQGLFIPGLTMLMKRLPSQLGIYDGRDVNWSMKKSLKMLT